MSFSRLVAARLSRTAVTRCFEASPWRFPSLLHARGETTGAATQRSMPSVLHLRTGVRIPPPPPDFAMFDLASMASSRQARVARRGPYKRMNFDEQIAQAFETLT